MKLYALVRGRRYRRLVYTSAYIPSRAGDWMTVRARRPRSSQTGGGSVAEPPPPPYAHEPATARVFQSGNSQAVRLPKQFRLKSNEVQIFRRGRDIVLREKTAKLSELFASLPELPDDALPDAIPDHPAEAVEES